MLKKFVQWIGGDPHKREIDRYSKLILQVNELEKSFEALSDEALRAKTGEFRARLAQGQDLDELLPEAFAAVREASKRTTGLRHYDVQLIGGAVLHDGKIAEMRTGEGKTLVATLPIYLNALSGLGVHLITVNDYLARRDARWMAPIFNALGLSVGVLQMAARTENGKKAFLVDLDYEVSDDYRNQLRLVPRAEAYAADILYGTNSEFGFDYLRDNMVGRMDERVQRGHHYAIIDEVDNVLIDEARTPLIISGPAAEATEWYVRMAQVARGLRAEDYELNEKDRTITLTELGEAHAEELLGITLRDPERPEDVTPEQARLLGYLEQALRAQYLFRRDKDYIVQAGKVIIVDEFTGRLMPGRRWSDGLHQAVEAKEGARVQSESVTYATITIQNYFRMYEKLAGMSGTAVTEAEEFSKIYNLEVLPIPTNLELQASRADATLEEVETKDPEGYKYNYYTRRGDPGRKALFYRRKDYPDIVYRTQEAKLRAIIQEIVRYQVLGRPMLIGTTSVELSERLSGRLRAEPVRRLAQVMLLRQAWFKQNNREEDGRQVAELVFLYEPLDKLDTSELRRFGRDLSISFNPEEPANLAILLNLLGLSETDRSRLISVLQGGVPHQVLNARKHTEESQIIAGAGAFGRVTIATNMAGRGVDIILGGDFPGSDLFNVVRVASRACSRAGRTEDLEVFNEVLSEGVKAIGYGKLGLIRRLIRWRKETPVLDPEDIGIYDQQVKAFSDFIRDYDRVLELGGLHVIGSERHEARRIDNQLRGRSARQGDPGSSRFFLSLEDDLMRLFGGQQVDGMMQRFKLDDAIPLEVGLVGRVVEQSQARVEGQNFDVRKHLLEYDDVLNTQRTKIYAQRDRIFVKDDLSDDVTEMLRTEVNRRVPPALEENEGPWRLLAWLDAIQPTLSGPFLYPSYTLRLLLDTIMGQEERLPSQRGIEGILEVARQSLLAEEQHLLHSMQALVEAAQEKYERDLNERMESLDTFFDGLESEGDEDGATPRRHAELVNELTTILRLPSRLSNEQQRLLREDPDEAREEIAALLRTTLLSQSLTRLVGAAERRLEEALGFSKGQLEQPDWDQTLDLVMGAIQASYARRRERYLGETGNGAGGQFARDLENALSNTNGSLSRTQIIQLLTILPQGTRMAFDKRTHRRMTERTHRLTYTYYAASLLGNRAAEDETEDILKHLEGAQEMLRLGWGMAEWARLSDQALSSLDERLQTRLVELLGEARFAQAAGAPLSALQGDERQKALRALGSQALSEIYRPLLVGVIGELWVDYLTQMEGLRVSIGLEAYAQRDPLVQYKNRAFGLFQDLMENMRTSVVTRMFTYRPRDLNTAQSVSTRGEKTAAANALPDIEPSPQSSEPGEIEEDENESAEPAETPNITTSQTSRAPGEKKKRRRRR